MPSKSTYPRRHSLAILLPMGSDDINLPPPGKGLTRLVLKLVIIAVAVYAAHLAMDWATARAETTQNDNLMIGVLATLLVTYALLIAIPFMPGIEIGISLLMLKGASIAPFVYLATLLGLMLAFAIGRCLPHRWLRSLLEDLRLKRACALIDRLAPLSQDERLALLTARAPRWLRPALGSGRYFLLAVLINIPGNAAIGGGGGIAFTAGFSRLFRPSYTMLTFVLAVLPVPLTVWLSGSARMLL